MTICDKCKKEVKTNIKRISIAYEYACKAWQEKTVDLCCDCSIKLNNVVSKAQADFINGEGRQ
jgi:hypothetical protein